MNHITMTGPNSRPILWVPLLWKANSPIRIASAIGTTRGASCGASTFTPSMADSTVTAGVSMPSP